MTPSAIATNDLTKRYGETTAVDRLSLDIPSGVVYGFLGPNGAGRLLPGVVTFVTLVPLLAAAIAVGRTLATGVRYSGVLAGFSAWTRRILATVSVGVLYVGSRLLLPTFLGGSKASIAIPTVLPGAPLRAYATVAFAPLGAHVRPLGVLIWAVVVAAFGVGLVAPLIRRVEMLK